MEQVKEIDINEKMKTEALSRMRSLRLMKQVMDEFEESGTIYYSERQNKIFDGILYYLENEPAFVKLAKELEERHGVLIYHAQLTHTYDGDLLSFLYVSQYEDEWAYEREDMKKGYFMAYVANIQDPMCSEFGTIGIAPRNGGVTRTA